MLSDSSSIRNLQRLGLDHLVKDLEIVTPIKEEIGETRIKQVHGVSNREVDALIRYLEQIAIRTGKMISIELEKNRDNHNIQTKNFILCYYEGKGKISLHHGEFYLLAKAVSLEEDLLCDDDAVEVISRLLSGICGINFKVWNTLDFLYNLYLAGQISASDFVDYFEDIEKKKLMHFKFPAKTMRDRYGLSRQPRCAQDHRKRWSE
ncbi:MAG: hypothetical protein ACE5KT_07115 [Methanosarcinales archaeon]